MPRTIILGNGSALVGYDDTYTLRDLFWPRVGKFNHTLGSMCRTGVFCDGHISWLDKDGWERKISYIPDTLVSHAVLSNKYLGVTLECEDYIDWHRSYLIRNMKVTSQRDLGDVRVFFHYDWYIGESDLGNTAFYQPKQKAVIAYKGNSYFLLGGQVENAEIGLSYYACGKKGGGRAGTWEDAADGNLSGNPIEQGAVDSTVGFKLGAIAEQNSKKLTHWVCMGSNFDEVIAGGQDVITERGEEHLRRRTSTYWQAWAGKDGDGVKEVLGEEAEHLYRRSALMARAHIDNQGGVVAACDFDITAFARDTYAYVWPRDGALTAYALDLAGHEDICRKFFEFCGRVMTKEGYLLHKYDPEGNVGSSWHPWVQKGELALPVQEDETGLVLWALWAHYCEHQNLDFALGLYASLVRPAAEWLSSYVDRSGLPLPSFDLWEERWGIHAFTIGAVWGGLQAAMMFADKVGDNDYAEKYRKCADKLKKATDKYLYRKELGRFCRRLEVGADGYIVDEVVDSALSGLWRFGMYDANDSRIVATMQEVVSKLSVPGNVGGIARYENDYYFRTEVAGPGNPWFICTLWLAQWNIVRARGMDELEGARDLLAWVASKQGPTGLLGEQLHPSSGQALSVSPLTWSHAEYVATAELYLRKCRLLARQIHGPIPGFAERRKTNRKERVLPVFPKGPHE